MVGRDSTKGFRGEAGTDGRAKALNPYASLYHKIAGLGWKAGAHRHLARAKRLSARIERSLPPRCGQPEGGGDVARF